MKKETDNQNSIDSEERYKSLFDGNFSIMLLIDPINGDIKDANISACNYYGWSHAEICRKKISEINILPSVEISQQMELAKKENRNIFLFKHLLSNGEIRDVEVYSGPIKFHDKTLLYSIVHDITERKIAEESLRRSEEKYRYMFDNNPQPMWIIDIETLSFLEVNKSAISHYGYSKAEFLNMTLKDIRPEKDIQALLKSIEFADKTENGVNNVGELQHIKKNGEIIDVEITAHSIIYNGKIASHALINDITEKKKSEKLIEQTRQNYETFFNAIDEFIFVLDRNGFIIHANATVFKRLKYEYTDLIGKSVKVVHPIEMQIDAIRIVSEMLLGKTDSCTIPLITKNGIHILVETRVTEGVWNGQPVIFGFSKDISKIKLSEEKFSKVFHLNPSVCGLSDIEENKFVEINDAFYNLLGFEKSEVIGKTPQELDIMSREDEDYLLSKAINNQSIKNISTTLKAKNGDLKYVKLSAEVIKVQEKLFRYIVVHDFTDIKKAEIEINDKVNLLTNLLINLEEGILLENSNREIVLTNQLFCDIFGIPAPPELLIGSDCSSSAEQSKNMFKNPDKFISDINKILQDKKAVLDDELELIDGRYFERDYLPTYIDNQYSGHLWKYKDITERKRAEIELRDSQALYRSFVEQMPAGVIRLDNDGKVIFVNSVFCEMENLDMNHTLGTKLEELIEQRSTDHSFNSLKNEHKPGTFSSKDLQDHEITMSEGSTLKYEERHLNADATVQHLQVVKYPVYSSIGAIIGSQGIQFDISERKRAEMALQLQSNTQKLLMEISSAYISLPIESINSTLNNSLGEIAKFVHADRAYIFDYDFSANVCNNTHEWCADGIFPQKEELQGVLLESIPEWVNTHRNGKLFSVTDVSGLPKGNLYDILESQGIKSLLTVPMMNNEKCLGFVGFDWVNYQHNYEEAELSILYIFSQMLVNIWQRKWSEEALLDYQKQLKNFASHLQNAREEERTILAREIHDDLGQKMAALKIDVGLLKKRLLNDATIESKHTKFVDEICNLVDSSILTTRRLLKGLRPHSFDELGFIGSVNSYIRDFEKRYEIETLFDCKIKELVLAEQKSIALYRILQESLNNVAKHSKASKVVVSLNLKDDRLTLEIIDDGIGFSTDKKIKIDSYGLIGMRERVFLLDGELTIIGNPGEGTRVNVTLPKDNLVKT